MQPLMLSILQVEVLPQELPIYLGSDIRLSYEIQGTLMKIITLHLLVIMGEGRNGDTRAGMWISCR